MKKKIMLIVPMLHQGGFEKVCVTTARLLEPFFDVYIVMFDSKDIAYDIKGLNVIDLHMGVKNDLPGKVYNVLRRRHAVKELKEKLNIDIAYSFGPTANIVNVLSGTGEKIWVGVRSYMDMANERKIAMFCKKSDRVLCCSKMIEEEITTRYKCKKAVTLYNPLDMAEVNGKAAAEEPRLPWDNREHIIASMGREDDVKGFWHLIKSFSLVCREVSDAKLVIIGDGDFEEYHTLAKRLNIAEHVYFTGMRKNPFPYLNTADVYVLTSYNEGFPNALLEAMALGIPVIATDCKTGPREILMQEYISEKESLMESGQNTAHGDYGVLISNMTPDKNMNPQEITGEEEHLAKEIIRMLSEDEYRAAYEKASVRRAKVFSNEYYVEQIKKLMND